MTLINGMTPLVLPALPTGSPIERTSPQYVPRPPPFLDSSTFSFQIPRIPSILSGTELRKQDIGSPLSVPPFDKIGVAGMNHSLCRYDIILPEWAASDPYACDTRANKSSGVFSSFQ